MPQETIIAAQARAVFDPLSPLIGTDAYFEGLVLSLNLVTAIISRENLNDILALLAPEPGISNQAIKELTHRRISCEGIYKDAMQALDDFYSLHNLKQ